MFEYLIFSQWHCLGFLRRCGFAGTSRSLWAALRFQSLSTFPGCSSCFLLVVQDVSSHFLFLPLPLRLLLLLCLPTMMNSYPSGTTSQSKLSYISCCGHGVVHRNRKVAKTEVNTGDWMGASWGHGDILAWIYPWDIKVFFSKRKLEILSLQFYVEIG